LQAKAGEQKKNTSKITVQECSRARLYSTALDRLSGEVALVDGSTKVGAASEPEAVIVVEATQTA
jgi:hypothetical protein